MGFTEGVTVNTAIKNAMGNDTVWQLLMIMVMLVLIEEEGVANHMASTSGTTTILLMWAILYSILQSAAYVPKERYSSLMVFGVVYASVLGFAAFPFKVPALAILRSYMEPSGNTVDYLSYMMVVIPSSLIMLCGYFIFMRFIMHPDLTRLKNWDMEAYFKNQNINKMSLRQKFCWQF